MGNIKTWLEEAEASSGERIEAVVIGQHYSRDSRWESDDAPLPDEHVVLSREDGLRKLDQEYNDGYGGADCFPMYAWSKSRVYFIHEYDGSTSLSSEPRNPVPCKPDF